MEDCHKPYDELGDCSRVFKNRYSSRTLVGNWYEDELVRKEEEAKIVVARWKQKQHKKRIKQLLTNFLKPTVLDEQNQYICYGAKVQLCSIDTKNRYCINRPLSLYIDEMDAMKNVTIGPHCGVTLAQTDRSYVRNTFIIQSIDSTNRNGQRLNYNEDFRLQCISASGEMLFLYSSVSVNQHRFALGPCNLGDGNQNVGVCQTIGNNVVGWDGCGSNIPAACCRWRCLYPKIDFRTNTENCLRNDPIPVN